MYRLFTPPPHPQKNTIGSWVSIAKEVLLQCEKLYYIKLQHNFLY